MRVVCLLVFLLSCVFSVFDYEPIIKVDGVFHSSFFYKGELLNSVDRVAQVVKGNEDSISKINQYKAVQDISFYSLLFGALLAFIPNEESRKIGVGISVSSIFNLISNNKKIDEAVGLYNQPIRTANNKYDEYVNNKRIELFVQNKVVESKVNDFGRFAQSMIGLISVCGFVYVSTYEPISFGAFLLTETYYDYNLDFKSKFMLVPVGLYNLTLASNYNHLTVYQNSLSVLGASLLFYPGPYWDPRFTKQ